MQQQKEVIELFAESIVEGKNTVDTGLFYVFDRLCFLGFLPKGTTALQVEEGVALSRPEKGQDYIVRSKELDTTDKDSIASYIQSQVVEATKFLED